MDVPLNAYEAWFPKEVLENVKMLQIGAPGSHSLRDVAAIIKAATAEKFATEDRPEEVGLFQYHNKKGDPVLIEQLSMYLTKDIYRAPVNSDDVIINNGSSAGVWNLMERLLSPGDTVFIEDPSYKTFFPCVKKSKYNLVGVSMDEGGIKIDMLEEKLKKLQMRTPTEKQPFTAIVYLIPVFHNPTTRSMSEERKRDMVMLARKYDLLIVADDVYNTLCYKSPECDDPKTARAPKRLLAYDEKSDPGYKGNVVSCGSFSKFMAPGLRLGWYELPTRVREIYLDHYIIRSGSGKNPYVGSLVGVALKMGLVQKHVKKTRVAYSEKMKAAHSIIMSQVGKLGVKCDLPEGGMFLWVQLPESVTAEEILEVSKDSVRFLLGHTTSPSGSFKNCLRIGIDFYEIEEFLEGITSLCGYIIRVINSTNCP